MTIDGGYVSPAFLAPEPPLRDPKEDGQLNMERHDPMFKGLSICQGKAGAYALNRYNL